MNLKTIDDLDNLKASGIKEGEKWEFKLTWPSTSLNVEKSICAFANTEGGIILLGVNYDDTNNQIVGFPGINKIRGLEERAVDIGGNINPRVIPNSWLIDVTAEKTVQVIQVLRSQMIPHMAGNYIYYQRVDKENMPISESLVEKLYLARQVQQQGIKNFLLKNKYFRDFPGDPHWLSICFCPLYLETDLIRHARSNLDFLNSLTDIISPSIVDLPFRTVPDGYKFEILHPKSIGKAIYNHLIKVFNTGVVVSGMWVKEVEPSWEYILSWFNRMISFYSKLKMKFRYPGWTKIIFVLTKMRNTQMFFSDSRMNALSNPMIEGDLFIQLDFEDSEIVGDHPDKVTEPFYTKVKTYYGLDDYIA